MKVAAVQNRSLGRSTRFPCGSAVLAAAPALFAMGALAVSCRAAPQARALPVTAAPPPKDDGTPAQGGSGGVEHAAALEQLRLGSLGWRADRQNSVRVDLPDADRWMRVKFWGVKSLVGFRYGKDHHAIVAGLTVPVADETVPGVCGTTFERWAQPLVESFEVTVEHDPPKAVPWNGKIVDIDSLVASTATLGDSEQYAVAYATYPAWKGVCLIVGVAVPARDELARAKAVRDRFSSDVLPAVQVMTAEAPKERY